MRRRALPYMIFFLLACLLAVLPAALAFDLATPVDKWENWYWPGQPAPRPKFGWNNLPPLLRGEETAYRLLVIPPGFARNVLTGFPGNYALTFISPGSSTEAPAFFPPAALALEHIRFALPFWFLSAVAIYELGAFIGRRRRHRVAVA